MSSEVMNEIRNIVSEIAECDPATIGENTHFIEELDLDSMLALEILAKLEKNYHIAIPEERLREFTTLKNVYDVVVSLQQPKAIAG